MSSRAMKLSRTLRQTRRWLPGFGDASVDLLWVILALTLVRGMIYAVLNPPFSSPDETDHFKFVQSLATFGKSGPTGAEGSQPIPYYALMVPAYWLTAGQPPAAQDLAIRLASLPFLLGMVLFTWLAGRKIAPTRPFVAALAAALVSLQSENTVIAASANNDTAANFMAAVLTYTTVSLISSGLSRLTAIGSVIAIAAALLTKGQILPVVAVTTVVLLVQLGRQSIRGRASKPYLYLGGGIGIALLAIKIAQSAGLASRAWSVLSYFTDLPRLFQAIAQRGFDPFAYQFTSFWGAFLGESVRPADGWYALPAAVLAIGACGYLVTSRLSNGGLASRKVLTRVALVAIIAAQWLSVYLYFASSYWEVYGLESLQGRYLLAALVPLALLVGEGWILLFEKARWRRAALGAFATAVIFLLVFDGSALSALVGSYSWAPSGW